MSSSLIFIPHESLLAFKRATYIYIIHKVDWEAELNISYNLSQALDKLNEILNLLVSRKKGK